MTRKRWIPEYRLSLRFTYDTLTPICNERDDWQRAGNAPKAERIQNVIDRAVRTYTRLRQRGQA